MGQYWKAVIANNEGTNRRIFGTPSRRPKLREHAFFGDSYVESICSMLYNGGRICWIGDHVSDDDIVKVIDNLSYKDIWENESLTLPDTNFRSEGKFLVNHSKREYLDLTEYVEACRCLTDNVYIFHPLPLLTALGNGKGLGDYPEIGIDYEYIGKWAWDIISVDDPRPAPIYQKMDYLFALRKEYSPNGNIRRNKPHIEEIQNTK